MGDRYRHHDREHVPIDIRSYLNYDPTLAMSGTAGYDPQRTILCWGVSKYDTVRVRI